jgi:hypothetical protein
MPSLFTKTGLALLLCLLIPKPAISNEKNVAIEEQLVQSGIHEQIRQFPKAMTYKIEQIYSMGQCDSQSFTIIRQAISETININTMEKIVSEDLQNHLNNTQSAELANWYNSPLGKKITEVELAASTPASYQAIKDKGELLFANKKHLATIKEIDKALHATDWAVNVELQSTIALLGGLAQIQHKDITANMMEFALQLDEQKALLRPQVEKSIQLWYLYAYKHLSNAELQEYLAFLQSKTASEFNQQALKSLSHAMTIVVEDFILNIEQKSQSTQPVSPQPSTAK